MRVSGLSLFIILLLTAAGTVSARSWRGITPLLSTREDVKLILGVPTKDSDHADYYELSDEIALVWYQIGSCDRCGFGWRVPSKTVTEIAVIPKSNYRKERYLVGNKSKGQDEGTGLVYYSDESEGISVETFRGIAKMVSYSPLEKEADLQCAQIEICNVHNFPVFDEFKNLSWEDEKARLDNYAIQMHERLSRGAIIVYGENPSKRNILMRSAERARKYLSRERSIHPNRILVLDGGYREEAILRLNIYDIRSAFRIFLFPVKDPKEIAVRKKR